MFLRNALFNELTSIEAMFLESRMRSAYSHAGALFEAGRSYDATNVRRELLGIIDDVMPAS